jgi:hypothetical protein
MTSSGHRKNALASLASPWEQASRLYLTEQRHERSSELTAEPQPLGLPDGSIPILPQYPSTHRRKQKDSAELLERRSPPNVTGGLGRLQ